MDLIKKTVISKATNSQGFITSVTSNGVQVSFTNGLGSICISFEKFDELLISDVSVSKAVNELKKNK